MMWNSFRDAMTRERKDSTPKAIASARPKRGRKQPSKKENLGSFRTNFAGMVSPRKARSETNISMRISLATLDVISSAAASEGTTRTEFMLGRARRRAYEVL